MPRMDYQKMKRSDYARQSTKYKEQPAQKARIGVTDSGSIKIQMVGEHSWNSFVESVALELKNLDYRLLVNPTLYFGTKLK